MTDTPPERPLLEVCCASAGFAVAAARAGADRVELCANLVEGGTTPSLGEIEYAVDAVGVPVMVMIRPRGGDFCYQAHEFRIMERDVDLVRESGARGAVFGLLLEDGRIDVERTRALVERARPMQVTFHRAFDVSKDLLVSVDALKACGVDRVLTSAGRPSVVDALDALAEISAAAGSELAVLACGSVHSDNVARIARVPGIREIHIGASTTAVSPMAHRVYDVPMGRPYTPDEYALEVADTAEIGAVVAALSSAEAR